MAPIRVGIIGLSAGQWAANAHLRYLQSAESKFSIVAVCNSSRDSAQRAIEALNLPNTVRASGNPQDLADADDVDLVVYAVRVDRHFATIGPALKASKNVLVEWLLGKNVAEAEELLRLSQQNGVRIAAVDCQGRFDAASRTVKKLLDDGAIGKILSTSLTGAGMIGGQVLDAANAYLGQIEVGGNLVTIPVGHFLDTFTQVLGPLRSFHSLLATQRPVVDMVNADGTVQEKNVQVTSSDQLLLHGALENGAVFSMHVRGGPPFKGGPGMEWHIYGETGEMWIRGPNMHLQIYGGTSVRLHDFATDKVHEMPLLKEAFDEWLPIHRNVARVYEAIASGETGNPTFCTFEQALENHRRIAEMYVQNGRTY
ncbi:hypothetical protein CERZMDRAFT_46197 [Cercospora zeae-maydis SCOH1-5]|uniref:Uncharacterized protein n=1 Tax=Cercospora zeae-maydis SCOH1-5 TaxID=717836 RepID=A0A6A6F8V6_9PEZI|nr:hypothetical protein CERZMDRAFT_46197 [Cercospora zeae-maydis SCOH1-5]